MSKKNDWTYGHSPAPQNWKEASDIIKAQQKVKKKREGPSLMERLGTIEEYMKERHGK